MHISGTLTTFESRLHQGLVTISDYSGFLSEANTLFSGVPFPLIVKWEKEFIKRGYYSIDITGIEGGGGEIPPPPENLTLPTISGTPIVGEILYVENGTWSNSPTSFLYQWKQDGGTNCSGEGATTSEYVIDETDIGFQLVVSETAQNSQGSNSVDSEPTTEVEDTFFLKLSNGNFLGLSNGNNLVLK
jgi:hypothetical protein